MLNTTVIKCARAVVIIIVVTGGLVNIVLKGTTGELNMTQTPVNVGQVVATMASTLCGPMLFLGSRTTTRLVSYAQFSFVTVQLKK